MSGSGSTGSSAALLPLRVRAGSTLVRIHLLGNGPIWFGPGPGGTPSRFDAPAGEYGTLYAAKRLPGAFAETVLRRARKVVSRDFVELRQWSELRVLRTLKLAKVYDNGLIWHGVTSDISAGYDYDNPRSFAGKLHANFPDLDGISYRAHHDNGEVCYALFERAKAALEVVGSRKFVAEPSITDGLMRRYNASWDPMTPP